MIDHEVAARGLVEELRTAGFTVLQQGERTWWDVYRPGGATPRALIGVVRWDKRGVVIREDKLAALPEVEAFHQTQPRRK